MSAAEAPVPVSVMDVFTVSGGSAQDEHIKPPAMMSSSTSSSSSSGPKSKFKGIPRWTLGILLLMVTVVMWTSSNFLASYIFADNTYSKPYFLTFVNTTVFALSLIPMLLKRLQEDQRGETLWLRFRAAWDDRGKSITRQTKMAVGDDDVQSPLIGHDTHTDATSDDEDNELVHPQHTLSNSHSTSRLSSSTNNNNHDNDPLPFREIVKLSIEFSSLWFAANYSAAACLEFTTVASATILTSTSSIWTLLFGSLMGVEIFSYKKLTGVLASVAGVILISSVDLSGTTDRHRGSFPHKTPRQLAIGDILALLSAVIYGFYTVLMKKRIGDESRVDVLLFFGLVGLSNLLLLWPGFFVLHYTGIETWEVPPSGRVWAVILTNSLTSFISDLSWAFAMLLTSPLVVTVGLGLTIPLSLIGQIILESQYASFAYWIGAGVVLMSFIFINYEVESGSGSSSSAFEEDQQLDQTSKGKKAGWKGRFRGMGRGWWSSLFFPSSASSSSSWRQDESNDDGLLFEEGLERQEAH